MYYVCFLGPCAADGAYFKNTESIYCGVQRFVGGKGKQIFPLRYVITSMDNRSIPFHFHVALGAR